jgi:lipopolysaccharide biosynthesis glycosyltransferase
MLKIVLSSDRNLVPFIPTLINSISVNNDCAEVYIIATNWEIDCDLAVNSKCPDNIKLQIIDFDNGIREGAFIHDVQSTLLSRAIYNRLFLPQLLPEVDKVIYLDLDTIVNADLTELYNSDTSDKGIAAVPDAFNYQLRKMFHKAKDYIFRDFKEKLGIEIDYNISAFNSGVVLMDLDKMQINGATERMLDILNKIFIADQPLLNLYCMGDWVHLDRKWNVSANHERIYMQVPEPWNILHWHGKKPYFETRPNQKYYEKYRV